MKVPGIRVRRLAIEIVKSGYRVSFASSWSMVTRHDENNLISQAALIARNLHSNFHRCQRVIGNVKVQSAAPWIVLAAYCLVTWWVTPRKVEAGQVFNGRSNSGAVPGVWLVAMSAAITWIFAKSIANASDLSFAFGIAGGIGYTIYYFSFVVAGVAIYFLRTRGGYRSLPHMLVEKYGTICAKLFLITIGFRLLNEVWSNTKVMSLYFGPEGSGSYWVAAILITLFTLSYAWTGGMRASPLTDRLQTVAIFALLGVVLAILLPGLESKGLPAVDDAAQNAGLTFCALAAVQVLSYPFHDPVLTDRGFISEPRDMLKSFIIAGVLSGGFIFLFRAARKITPLPEFVRV